MWQSKSTFQLFGNIVNISFHYREKPRRDTAKNAVDGSHEERGETSGKKDKLVKSYGQLWFEHKYHSEGI